MLARDIMNKEVITVPEDSTIEEAAELLSKNKISGAPVVDKEGKMVGIVTEGDLLHKLTTGPKAPGYLNILGAFIYINGLERFQEDLKKLAAIQTSDIMTPDVITADGDTQVENLAALMVEHGIKRIPIIENENTLIGIISRADIVRTLAQQATS